MAYLNLQPQPIPEWFWTGSTATLRIFASQAFYEATTLAYVPRGIVTNIQSACQVYECTVVDNVLTIPEVTLATTTDSNVPNAVYTAILYDANNVPRYNFLENFFCDPYFFQSPPQYSVLVADAGTAAANGVYTYRGLFNNLPYYNLEGEADSTTLFAIVNTGSQWRLLSSSGANLYHSSSNTDFPYDSVWVNTSPSTGTSPAPNVSQDSNEVSGTWFQLTLSNQASATVGQPFQWNAPFWNVEQTKQYVSSVVGDGTTPFASEPVVGKTALTTNPDLSTFPVAYGANDPAVPKFRGALTKAALDALTGNVTGQFAKLTDKDKGLWRYSSARWVPVDSGRKVNVLDFCDPAANDNTAALQSIIDYLNTQGGGTISFPAGFTIKCASLLDITSKANITFEGTNTFRQESSTVNLQFTGAGSGAFIDARSSFGFCVRNMHGRYTNASYTGNFIQLGHDASNADTQRTCITGNVIEGTPTAFSAAKLIDVAQSIDGKIEDNHFLYAEKGIVGSVDSIVWQVVNNDFNIVKKAIYNPGNNWYIRGCTFEPDSDGSVIALDSDGVAIPRSLTWMNNWVGDQGVFTQAQVTFKKVRGLTYCGTWSTVLNGQVGVEMQECEGAVVLAMRAEQAAGTATTLLLNGTVGAGNAGVFIAGNDMTELNIVRTGSNRGITQLSNTAGGEILLNAIGDGLRILPSSGTDELSQTELSLQFGGVQSVLDTGVSASMRIATGISGFTDGALMIGGRTKDAAGDIVYLVPTGTPGVAGIGAHFNSTAQRFYVPYGYFTGVGGAIVQSTSKSTGVTLDKICGQITMNSAALADNTTVSFTVTNSTVAALDVVTACHASAGTAGAYLVSANAIAAGSFKISVRNISGGSLSQAIVLTYSISKAANS